jgi:hypothetical protein
MREDGWASGLAAEEVGVTLFRQILLVPFAIEPTRAGDPKLASGRCRVKALAGCLADPWQEVKERWRHLPEDDGAEGQALATAYAEFVYFEPYVQRFLFGRPGETGADAPVRLWRRRDIRALDLAVRLDVLRSPVS